MDFVVGLRCVMAGVLEDYCIVSDCYEGNERLAIWEKILLPMPPGCSGANSVRSQTCPSTTIHRSFALLCSVICSVERSLGSVIAADEESIDQR